MNTGFHSTPVALRAPPPLGDSGAFPVWAHVPGVPHPTPNTPPVPPEIPPDIEEPEFPDTPTPPVQDPPPHPETPPPIIGFPVDSSFRRAVKACKVA
jgi:hypothetical protein